MAASENNVTIQKTAKFACNLTANIKLSEHLSFFPLTANKFFKKSKNAAAKKNIWWSSCSESTQKTNLLQLFCNVVGYKSQISIVLGCR